MGGDPGADKELTSGNFSSRAERIAAKLNELLAPATLDVIDDSAKHKGHAGAAPGGETHYRVRAVSAAFTGLNRVARQRLVLDALKGEFDTGLHALALDLKAPGES